MNDGAALLPYLIPALVALVAWWVGTGAVLFLDRLPRSTHRGSLAVVTGLLGLAFLGTWFMADIPTVLGAYGAFASALAIWGWNELCFLTGFVTGPRREACAEDCRGPRHVWHAIEIVLYHEIALALCGLAIFALTWGGANPVGLWTYGVLWAMRVSAKLNLFLGVPNPSGELLPPHMAYLHRYLPRRAASVLLPLSLLVSGGVTALLVHRALGASAGFEATAYGLTATLLALGVLEHVLMAAPIQSTALWRIFMRESPGSELDADAT